MFEIVDYNDLISKISNIKRLKKKFYTNFFLDEIKVRELISRKALHGIRIEDTLFLFNDKSKFLRLYYFSSSELSLSSSLGKINSIVGDKLLVLDIIGRFEDTLKLGDIFKQNGFIKYVTLNRMYRRTIEVKKQVSCLNLRLADIDEAITIYNMLNEYFDFIAEQLPTTEEIINWIKNKHIIVYGLINEIQGFLIYDKIGVTSYLRYWFVHPLFRNKQIGSALINKYFENSWDTRRQIFWVIQSNGNAIKRYEHYGFINENLIDDVFTNKEINYEEESN